MHDDGPPIEFLESPEQNWGIASGCRPPQSDADSSSALWSEKITPEYERQITFT